MTRTAPRFLPSRDGFTAEQLEAARVARRALVGAYTSNVDACPRNRRADAERGHVGVLRQRAHDVGLTLNPSSVEHVWSPDGTVLRSTGWAPWAPAATTTEEDQRDRVTAPARG